MLVTNVLTSLLLALAVQVTATPVETRDSEGFTAVDAAALPGDLNPCKIQCIRAPCTLGGRKCCREYT